MHIKCHHLLHLIVCFDMKSHISQKIYHLYIMNIYLYHSTFSITDMAASDSRVMNISLSWN